MQLNCGIRIDMELCNHITSIFSFEHQHSACAIFVVAFHWFVDAWGLASQRHLGINPQHWKARSHRSHMCWAMGLARARNLTTWDVPMVSWQILGAWLSTCHVTSSGFSKGVSPRFVGASWKIDLIFCTQHHQQQQRRQSTQPYEH